MPTLEDLIGTSTEELESLTDEQLLEKFKDIFILEPPVEEKDIVEEDAEGVGEPATKINKATKPTTAKQSRKAKRLAEHQATMKMLLELEQDINKGLKDKSNNTPNTPHGTNQTTTSTNTSLNTGEPTTPVNTTN